jgi:hypothetical protein
MPDQSGSFEDVMRTLQAARRQLELGEESRPPAAQMTDEQQAQVRAALRDLSEASHAYEATLAVKDRDASVAD